MLLGSSRYKFYSIFPTKVSNLLKTLVNEDRDFRSSGPLDERKNDLGKKKPNDCCPSKKKFILKSTAPIATRTIRLSGQNPDPNPRPPSTGIFLHTLSLSLSTLSHSSLFPHFTFPGYQTHTHSLQYSLSL